MSGSKDLELAKTREAIIERLGSVKRGRSGRKSFGHRENAIERHAETEWVTVDRKDGKGVMKEELSQPSSPRSLMSEEARNRSLWVDEEGKGNTLYSSRERLRDEEAAEGLKSGEERQRTLEGFRKAVKVGQWRRSRA